VSDGEDNRSLAGWRTHVRRFLPGRGGRALFADRRIDEARPFESKTLRPFIDAMRAIPTPVIVDLGPVSGANVSFLGDRLACKLHPVDLRAEVDQLVKAGEEARIAEVIAARAAHEPASVDGILAWDVFDGLLNTEAKALARQLVAALKPGGLLLGLFTTAPLKDAESRAYAIVDDDHLRCRRVQAARKPARMWLPGDVGALLAPLEVVHSRLLAHHYRETLLRQPAAQRKDR
jgi:hypothetical protein